MGIGHSKLMSLSSGSNFDLEKNSLQGRLRKIVCSKGSFAGLISRGIDGAVNCCIDIQLPMPRIFASISSRRRQSEAGTQMGVLKA